MSVELTHAIEQVHDGRIGIFPAKNGYMLVGSGASNRYEETSERIRAMKRKSVVAPLVRVSPPDEMLGMVQQNVSESLQLVRAHITDPLIWGVPTEAFLESGHDRHDIGITPWRNPWEKRLVRELGCMIIASSANLSGGSTPFSIESVDEPIRDQADFEFDVGPLDPQPDLGVLRLPELTVIRDSVILRQNLQQLEHNR